MAKPILVTVAAGAQTGTAWPTSRRAVSVLIAIPLWLMTAMLSPTDAYETAKAIAGQHQSLTKISEIRSGMDE
jgi:hypothetical protein